MEFIKLNPGETQRATVRTRSPIEVEKEWQGKKSLSYRFEFDINDVTCVLDVSKTSAAYANIQNFSVGDVVIITKKELGGGRSTYDVVPEGDITQLPHNKDLVKQTPKQINEDNAHAEREKKNQTDRERKIAWGQCCNAASRVVAMRADNKDNVKTAKAVKDLAAEMSSTLYPTLFPDVIPDDLPF